MDANQHRSVSKVAAKYRAMAANLGTVVVQTGVRMVTGQKWKRTPEERAACLAVCKGIEGQTVPCPEWTGLRCGKCRCVGKFAAFLDAKDCPLGKWPAPEGAEK